MLRRVLTAALLLVCCTLSTAFAPPVHNAALCLKQIHTGTSKPAAQQRNLHALQAKTPEEEAEDDRWAKNPYGWTTGPIARRNGLVVQVGHASSGSASCTVGFRLACRSGMQHLVAFVEGACNTTSMSIFV
jgi:hypothetical protein